MPDHNNLRRDKLSKEEILSQSPLLSSLTPAQLEELSNHISLTKLKEGETLFKQGDEYHSFYLVVSGLMKLYRHSPSGQEKIIELEESGKTFAEALMFSEQSHYPVTATAMQDSVLYKISGIHFRNLLVESPETSMSLMADLSLRLHSLLKEIDNLSLLTGRNRVSMYLLDQALTKGNEFRLDIPKNAIANKLSIKPETFSRLLKELSKRNTIEVHDSHIIVLDLQTLRELAGIAG
ncbi:MAG: Crp/Fnr family transcriptional regulator [Gammaproteobacteria bacterium]|nr:Crp/Fnr family transcriptional regulator [Gammaproteobacteria bacterium]